jgi:hypothetical protein
MQDGSNRLLDFAYLGVSRFACGFCDFLESTIFAYFAHSLSVFNSVTPSAADYAFSKYARERKIWKYKILLYFNSLGNQGFSWDTIMAPPPVFPKGDSHF